MNSEQNCKNKKRKERIGSNFFYDFVKITGAIPALILLRPKIYYPEGKEIPEGAALISSNHHTIIDPIIILASFPFRRIDCLVTKDLYKNKVMTMLLNAWKCIQVDKENFSLDSFHRVVDRLNLGKMVLIFPEGQVTTGQQNPILTFKSGIILMAHKSGAPVMPVYIVRRKKWWHRQHLVVGRPVDIRSIVGAIPTMDQITAASEYLRNKEYELQCYYENLTKNN